MMVCMTEKLLKKWKLICFHLVFLDNAKFINYYSTANSLTKSFIWANMFFNYLQIPNIYHDFKYIITEIIFWNNTTHCEKCPKSDFFRFVFFRIRTEYGEVRSISKYSVGMGKIRTRVTPNTDTFCEVRF